MDQSLRSHWLSTDYESSYLTETSRHSGQSAHVHKACGLLQKGTGRNKTKVIKFVWPWWVLTGRNRLLLQSFWCLVLTWCLSFRCFNRYQLTSQFYSSGHSNHTLFYWMYLQTLNCTPCSSFYYSFFILHIHLHLWLSMHQVHASAPLSPVVLSKLILHLRG